MTSLPLLLIPHDGQEFLDIDAMSVALDDWAVKLKFSFRVQARDSTRAVWVCAYASEGCFWRCRACYNSDEYLWTLVIVNGEHSCIQSQQKTHSSASKKDWLDRTIAANMAVTTNITLQQIMDFIRIYYAETIEYDRAQRCWLRFLDGNIGTQRRSFQFLLVYQRHWIKLYPGIHVALECDIYRRFKRIFICSSGSRTSFQMCRRLVAVDGTFLKSRFVLILLLAVAINANNETFILAWAVAESENKSSLEWVFQHLSWAIPNISTMSVILLSDRDKGLIEAEAIFGPFVVPACCYHHIKENFTTQYGKGLASYFRAIARAKTADQHTSVASFTRKARGWG
jgi:hypothetical protein